FGGVTPEQMEAFGEVAERYAPMGRGHITTRQNFQFHHIPLPDAAEVIRMISDSGLSSREACGNTVRNVTGDPWAGVTEGELYDFVEVDNGDYLKVSEAVLRIFNRQEDLRANRQRARIKFMIDRIGIDAFRELVEEELGGDWTAERDFTPDPLLFIDDEQANAPPVRLSPGSPNGDGREFDRFVAANVHPQRQAGFSTIEVKVTRGDLTPEQFRGIAAIMRDHTGGYARTSIQQ